MSKTFFLFFVVSAGLFAAPADGFSPFSALNLRETSSGAVLAGTVSLPRGLSPTVAAHVDIVSADGRLVASDRLASAHPRLAGNRLRRFVAALPEGFVPVQLTLHHGVH